MGWVKSGEIILNPSDKSSMVDPRDIDRLISLACSKRLRDRAVKHWQFLKDRVGVLRELNIFRSFDQAVGRSCDNTMRFRYSEAIKRSPRIRFRNLVYEVMREL